MDPRKRDTTILEEVAMSGPQFRVQLSVGSRALGLETLSARLASAADPKLSFDAQLRYIDGPEPIRWSTWASPLSLPPGVHAGTEGLSSAIESLAPSLAMRVASLVQDGCEATLNVVQELRDDSESCGIHLSAAAVAWLSAAGASIDVDQYVVVDEGV